jgi:hypothetical protein
MNIENKLCTHFNTTNIKFDSDMFFNFSLSCTVNVDGVWHDVFFDNQYNIVKSLKA